MPIQGDTNSVVVDLGNYASLYKVRAISMGPNGNFDDYNASESKA
jgi:hypothetical protein